MERIQQIHCLFQKNQLGKLFIICAYNKKKNREREEQLKNLAKELEVAKRDNYELKEDNKEFIIDIDKYLLMIQELTMINQEVILNFTSDI